MKRGTDLKFKFRDLKAKLDMRDWQVKGILQSLWDFTAENAMAGDVGRFTNSQIALGIDYDGNADSLVDALVATRWVDEHETHRLVIHDWREHCEEWIKKRCLRAGIELCPPRGRQRQTTADNGSLPGPGPGPGPDPDPVPEPNPGPDPGSKQTRAGPGSVEGNMAGSDRKLRDRFRSIFSAEVCHALGLNGQPAMQQRRSLFAVARRIYDRRDRDKLAKRFIAIATEKRDAGLDKPIAAWQKAVNEILGTKGVER